jgi:hypothetical protein
MTYLFSSNTAVINEVEVKNDVGNTIPIIVFHNGNAVAVTNRFPVDSRGNVAVDGLQPDAFGRLRVSEPFTLGDYKHLYAIDPNFIDQKDFGGNVIYVPNKAAATLTTNSSPRSNVVHQTKFYHHYQPGKSQLIFSSVNFGYAQQNVTKRTGYFDDRDGIYFEQVGDNSSNGTTSGNLNFVIRSFTSGTANESDEGVYKRRVPQSQWNVDKCDGTGPSGLNLDMSKTQLVFIDFQWLGVGRARVGFVHDGEVVVAHEYYHSNVVANVYLSTPNLPVRCEMRNTGPTSGGSMDQICSSVMSEGGYVESGIDFANVMSTVRTTASPGGTELPLIALRLKNTFAGFPNRISVRFNNLSLYCETNSVSYKIIKLPNAGYIGNAAGLGQCTWVSAADSSGVELCTDATQYFNGDVFAGGYVPSGASQNSLSPVASGSLSAAKKNIIVQNIESSNSEIYAVVVKTLVTQPGTVASVAAAVQWREVY